MLREDYVTRLATQFGRALARILGLGKRKDYPAALAAIDEALDQWLGLSLDSATRLSEDQLTAFLTLGGTAAEGWDKVSFLAALLKQAGAIHALQDRPTASYECYLKALHLVLQASLPEGESRFPPYARTVEELVAELEAYVLPARASMALMRYYEQIGAYGRAEDALFEALQVESENVDVIEEGVSFYERLRRQSDEALLAGNLPRDEVEAGLAEVQVYRKYQGETI